jgi:peptidylprolyl isomerase
VPAAKLNDKVKVHYTGRLDDGTVFDSSRTRAPLQFVLGRGEMIPGFERAVEGMRPGEAKTVRVPPEQAYGLHRKEMVLEVGKSQVPADAVPREGQTLAVRSADGRRVHARVTSVTAEKVVLDANHALAGRELFFDIELLEIL